MRPFGWAQGGGDVHGRFWWAQLAIRERKVGEGTRIRRRGGRDVRGGLRGLRRAIHWLETCWVLLGELWCRLLLVLL